MFEIFPTEILIEEDEFAEMSDAFAAFSRNVDQKKSLPDHLFHYTNTIGFEGIISSGVIRATHILYLNDIREYQYAVETLRIAVQKRIAALKNDNFERHALGMFCEQLSQPLKISDFPPYFVACFSAKQDDLSQWRAYGQGEGGVAIGFAPDALDRNARREGVWLVPVFYKEKEQEELIHELLELTLKLFYRHAQRHRGEQNYPENWYRMWRVFSSRFGPLLKDPSFIEENEWRICAMPKSLKNVNFLAKPRTLVPFIEINLGKKREEEPDLLPITVVWSGPGRENTLLSISTRHFLNKYDYKNVSFECSTVPYRTA